MKYYRLESVGSESYFEVRNFFYLHGIPFSAMIPVSEDQVIMVKLSFSRVTFIPWVDDINGPSIEELK